MSESLRRFNLGQLDHNPKSNKGTLLLVRGHSGDTQGTLRGHSGDTQGIVNLHVLSTTINSPKSQETLRIHSGGLIISGLKYIIT